MATTPHAFETLQLTGLGRSFGGHAALAGLDLTIRAGEFIALLGPSGCGKSTALNCLAGLLPLTHGTITMDEKRIDTLAPEQRGFGMVFQNYALFPHMSVERNIAFGLQMRKVSRGETKRRVAEAIALVKLEAHAKKLPGQLSGGQQQRVAIARAIVLEPSLVLMDEPLSNLDAKLRLDMRTEIRRLHQSLGLTTIYVTHDQEEALSMADRLVVLREGRVQQVGTPEELHTAPVNWHVADFMGYRNLLDVTVTEAGADGVLVSNEDLRIRGTAVGRVTQGGAARLAIRPEDLRIATGEDSGDGLIDAEVAVVEYHGREFSVGATAKSGTTLYVRSELPPTPGDDVRLRVDPARALVFAADLDAAGEPAAEATLAGEAAP